MDVNGNREEDHEVKATALPPDTHALDDESNHSESANNDNTDYNKDENNNPSHDDFEKPIHANDDKTRSQMPPSPTTIRQLPLNLRFQQHRQPSAPEDAFERLGSKSSGQQSKSVEDLHNHLASPTTESDPGDPEEQIDEFDWNDLEHRYQARIRELDTRQDEIMLEFGALCDYFALWADVGAKHETERGVKRLKTQIAYVKHHEEQLEQRRTHYVAVVDAFKGALQLLNR